MRLAQLLIEAPRMFNHARGLWGYSGPAKADGEPLTVQATGMGAPSAAIVVSELIDLGATTLIRLGTCGALQPTLALGDLVAVADCLPEDGVSTALLAGPVDRTAPDATLTGALIEQGARPVTAVSTDLFYGAEERHAGWVAAGADVVEMECGALFALAARRGVRAAAALLVTDTLHGPRRRLDPEALAAGELRLGALAG
jgi:uridine phosphorylase